MRRRGRRGEGCIYVRKDKAGKPEAVVAIVTYTGADGKRRRLERRCRTRTEAKDALIKLRVEAKRRLQGHEGRPALRIGELLDRWMDDSVKVRLRPATARTYRYEVDAYIKPYLKRAWAHKLRRADIQHWLSELARAKSPAVAKRSWTTLRAALRWAVKVGLLESLDTGAVEPPRAPKPEPRALTPEDARRLLAACEAAGGWIALYARLLVDTGMRPSEGLALQWGDLDLDQGYAVVMRALDTAGAVSELKTEASRRVVRLSPTLCERLRAWRVVAPDVEWVFANPDTGRPYRRDTAHQKLKRVADAIGVKADLYALRHTCATTMYALTGDIRAVCDQLGHSSITVTSDRYIKSVDDRRRRATDMLFAALDADKPDKPDK